MTGKDIKSAHGLYLAKVGILGIMAIVIAKGTIINRSQYINWSI